MRTRTYNPASSIERQKLTDLISSGKTVVCASRPLPGDEYWIGEWCGGVHWAIGQLSQFEKQWERLDAAIISLVSNQELLVLAKDKYYERRKVYHPLDRTLDDSAWEKFSTGKSDMSIVKMMMHEANWLKE
ncbi:hypothetical protein [Chamaesiphon sp.]|uniref:hypothetical protein n=1 Tax=Chamaesiphon sp. TaxID=2814140 RepID=UPI0035940B52